MRAAARQMSRMVWGFCSDLRRLSAARVFCLEVRGVVQSGERIEDAVERWRRWRLWVREWRRRERRDMGCTGFRV